MARSDEELFKRLKVLTNELPQDTELHRVLLNLDDPVHDEPSRDRYVAIVSAGAVEEGLKAALARRRASDPAGTPHKKLKTFDDCIKEAKQRGLISDEEVLELDRLRSVRNTFAHALSPVSFSTPEVKEVTKRLWNHPVTTWSAYFASSFPPRHQFAIVCAEFYSKLVRDPG